MSRAKAPAHLVLVVVACLLVGVIGFQAIAERTRVKDFYRRLQEKDDIHERLKLRLTAAVEKQTRVEAENIKLRSEKDVLQKQLIDLGSSRKDQLVKFEKEVKELKGQIQDKWREVTKRTQEVNKLSTEVEKVKSKAASGREQKEKELVVLQEKNAALLKEVSDLHEENEKLKAGGNPSEPGKKVVLGEASPKADDNKSESETVFVNKMHKRSTEEDHQASQSVDIAVGDFKRTDKYHDDSDRDKMKSDVEKDDGLTDRDVQIGSTTENDEELENNDFQDENGDEEGKTLEDDKEGGEAEDEIDEKEDDKDLETKGFRKGDDEEDTELDEQDEADALENTE